MFIGFVIPRKTGKHLFWKIVKCWKKPKIITIVRQKMTLSRSSGIKGEKL